MEAQLVTQETNQDSLQSRQIPIVTSSDNALKSNTNSDNSEIIVIEGTSTAIPSDDISPSTSKITVKLGLTKPNLTALSHANLKSSISQHPSKLHVPLLNTSNTHTLPSSNTTSQVQNPKSSHLHSSGLPGPVSAASLNISGLVTTSHLLPGSSPTLAGGAMLVPSVGLLSTQTQQISCFQTPTVAMNQSGSSTANIIYKSSSKIRKSKSATPTPVTTSSTVPTALSTSTTTPKINTSVGLGATTSGGSAATSSHATAGSSNANLSANSKLLHLPILDSSSGSNSVTGALKSVPVKVNTIITGPGSSLSKVTKSHNISFTGTSFGSGLTTKLSGISSVLSQNIAKAQISQQQSNVDDKVTVNSAAISANGNITQIKSILMPKVVNSGISLAPGTSLTQIETVSIPQTSGNTIISSNKVSEIASTPIATTTATGSAAITLKVNYIPGNGNAAVKVGVGDELTSKSSLTTLSSNSGYASKTIRPGSSGNANIVAISGKPNSNMNINIAGNKSSSSKVADPIVVVQKKSGIITTNLSVSAPADICNETSIAKPTTSSVITPKLVNTPQAPARVASSGGSGIPTEVSSTLPSGTTSSASRTSALIDSIVSVGGGLTTSSEKKKVLDTFRYPTVPVPPKSSSNFKNSTISSETVKGKYSGSIIESGDASVNAVDLIFDSISKPVVLEGIKGDTSVSSSFHVVKPRIDLDVAAIVPKIRTDANKEVVHTESNELVGTLVYPKKRSIDDMFSTSTHSRIRQNNDSIIVDTLDTDNSKSRVQDVDVKRVKNVLDHNES